MIVRVLTFWKFGRIEKKLLSSVNVDWLDARHIMLICIFKISLNLHTPYILGSALFKNQSLNCKLFRG